MGQTYHFRITQGDETCTLLVTYRWYVPGNDPWSATPTYFAASSGDWENRAIAGSTSTARLYAEGVTGNYSSRGQIIELYNTSNLRVNDTGTGYHFCSGYRIYEGDFNWELTNIT
jgi:hypothetical protein